MGFLKGTTTWTNFELSFFKISVFFCGIIAGYFIEDYLQPILPYLIGATVLMVIRIGFLWIKKMG